MDRNTYILYGARANSFAIRRRKIDLKKISVGSFQLQLERGIQFFFHSQNVESNETIENVHQKNDNIRRPQFRVS